MSNNNEVFSESCETLQSCEAVQHYKERLEYLESLVRKYKFDYLTGLMGKRDFMEKFDTKFEEYKFASESFYLVLIDINNLHNINRKEGYYVGDKVIKNVATRLLDLFEFHQVFRISGDEFVVLIRSYHLDESKLISDLDTIPNITYYCQKSTDFVSPKHMFKYVDRQLTDKKSKFSEKRL
jgi:diguanylate cyclase (GGDEF)-like protein